MYQKILVPIDGSETSMLGLNEAIKVAKSLGSKLRLLHIVNEFVLDYSYGIGSYGINLIDSLREGGKHVIEQAEAYVRQQGMQPESVLLEAIGDSAADLIVAHAIQWPADLIVMGTHGRRGLRRLALGSDAEWVVRESPVPVLLVHDMSKKRRYPPRMLSPKARKRPVLEGGEPPPGARSMRNRVESRPQSVRLQGVIGEALAVRS